MEYIAKNIPLWQVTTWDKKFNNVDRAWQPKTIKYNYLLSDELDEIRTDDGDVRILYTGKDVGYTTESLAGDNLSEGEIVSIPWGGIPTVKYYKGKFVTGDNRIATSNDVSKLSNRYLYYFMKGHIHEIASYYRGASLKHPCMKDVLKMEISYPSIEIQNKICDQFDVIESVIEQRSKELTLFDDLIKARFVELFGDPICNSRGLPLTKGDSFFKLSNGKFVPEAKRFEEGIPVYGGNGISWYTDEALLQENTIVVGRVGFQSGNIHYAEGPLMISDNAMYISWYDSEKYDLLFLCHLMEHIDFKRLQDAGDLKKITQKPFMSMEYIQPSLEQQYIYKSFVKQVDKSKVVA